MRHFAGFTRLNRATVMAAAKHLGDEQIRGLRELFKSYDTNGQCGGGAPQRHTVHACVADGVRIGHALQQCLDSVHMHTNCCAVLCMLCRRWRDLCGGAVHGSAGVARGRAPNREPGGGGRCSFPLCTLEKRVHALCTLEKRVRALCTLEKRVHARPKKGCTDSSSLLPQTPSWRRAPRVPCLPCVLLGLLQPRCA
jgi:hypothetical protein